MDDIYVMAGTKVRLRNGGPMMTVQRGFGFDGEEYNLAIGPRLACNLQQVECVWFDKSDQLHTARFLGDLLEVCFDEELE